MSITSQSCTLCGCKNTHPATYHITTPRLLESKTKAEDIKQINKELSDIEQSIELLYLKRASLRSRLNDLQSITCSIPPEILSHVMEIATPVAKPVNRRDLDIPKTKLLKYVPLNLSAVSSHWRRVARATPRIWTSLRIELDLHVNKEVCEKKKIELLRYYFERAKSLPLSLAFGNFYEPNADDYKQLFDVALQENPTRIQALYATLVLVDWTGHSGEQKIYHQMETLELSVPMFAMAHSSWTLPVLPALQRLTLSRARDVILPITTITYLNLSDMSYDDCFNLLLTCKETLVEFQCRMPLSARDPDWLGNNPQIHTIPRLQIIRWDMSSNNLDSPWDILLLQRLDLPSLRNASLLGLAQPHVLECEPKLFKKSSSPLSRIHISTVDIATTSTFQVPKEDLLRFLDMNTEHLSLYAYGEEICLLLNALTPSYHPDKKLLMPGLQALSLSGDLPPLRIRVYSLDEAEEDSSDAGSSDDSQSTDTDDDGSDHNSSNDDIDMLDNIPSDDDGSDHDEPDDNESDSDEPDDDESDGDEPFEELYAPVSAGKNLCEAIIQMLKERLPSTEETPKTVKKPFVLTLWFKLPQDYPDDYVEKLRPFVDAGLLQLVVNQEVQ